MSKQHQLEDGMYCVPETAEHASELLRFAGSLGFTLSGYSKIVMYDSRYWVDGVYCPKAVAFIAGKIYPMHDPINQNKQIPVKEFIQRLKGEWNEQKKNPA